MATRGSLTAFNILEMTFKNLDVAVSYLPRQHSSRYSEKNEEKLRQWCRFSENKYHVYSWALYLSTLGSNVRGTRELGPFRYNDVEPKRTDGETLRKMPLSSISGLSKVLDSYMHITLEDKEQNSCHQWKEISFISADLKFKKKIVAVHRARHLLCC